MKFRCDRDALSEALQTVQRGVSSRPGIPALTGVLIEASSEGALTLTTTDLEVSARLSIDVQVGEPGISLVPAFPFEVSIESGDVGGPSAGLMWALGLHDLLTPGDLTDGIGRDEAVPVVTIHLNRLTDLRQI